MITFKQFIAREDIAIDDSSHSKEDSGDDVTHPRIEQTKWKTLPITSKFPIQGFTIKYNRDDTIALFDDEEFKAAVIIHTTTNSLEVPGGTAHGIMTKRLSSAEEYRGRGLVVELYKSLAENGQNLFSSTLQTSGGADVWKRLVRQTSRPVFGVIPVRDLDRLGLKMKNPPRVGHILIQGNLDNVSKYVYKSGAAYWFISGDNATALAKHAVKV